MIIDIKSACHSLHLYVHEKLRESKRKKLKEIHSIEWLNSTCNTCINLHSYRKHSRTSNLFFKIQLLVKHYLKLFSRYWVLFKWTHEQLNLEAKSMMPKQFCAVIHFRRYSQQACFSSTSNRRSAAWRIFCMLSSSTTISDVYK